MSEIIAEEIYEGVGEQMYQLALRWVKDNMNGKEWPENDWKEFGAADADNMPEYNLNLYFSEDEDGNLVRMVDVYKDSRDGKPYVTQHKTTVNIDKLPQDLGVAS